MHDQASFLTTTELAVLEAVVDRLVPPHGEHPGAASLGAADYIDGLLAAFEVDPPRIWAGGPDSGRHGGEPSFGELMALGPLEDLAWRTRIEGSRGIPERERLGRVNGWQQDYRDGLGGLGTDFVACDAKEQDRRLDVQPAFRDLVYEHACEGAYGAPEYGGNLNLAGWRAIQYPGDVQPRGYTDAEVTGRE